MSRSEEPAPKRTLRRLAGVAIACLLATGARAQIVVVSSQQSGFAAIAREELEQLYLGRSRSLADGTPVAVIDLPAGAERDRFYQRLTGKNPIQIRAYWSRQVFTGRALPPREASSNGEAKAWIATDPRLIGYLPAAEVDRQLKVLLLLP